MKNISKLVGSLALIAGLFILNKGQIVAQISAPGVAAPGSGILHSTDLEHILPPAVFFKGQTATVQLRNSGGVRFSDGSIMFATKVDTSGYSSNVQEKYQAFLVTEVPLHVGEKVLAAGAYGVGFLVDGTFLVMDVGGHDLFRVATKNDAALKRPTPLQVLAEPGADGYRLYSGRTYVTYSRGQ